MDRAGIPESHLSGRSATVARESPGGPSEFGLVRPETPAGTMVPEPVEPRFMVLQGERLPRFATAVWLVADTGAADMTCLRDGDLLVLRRGKR